MKTGLTDKIKKSKMLQQLLVLCGAIAFYMFLNNFEVVKKGLSFVLRVMSPIISGTVMAYLLYPIVVFFRDKVFKGLKNRTAAHTIAVVITIIITLLIVVGLIALIVPQVTESVSYIINNFGPAADKVGKYFKENIASESLWSLLNSIGFNPTEIDWKAVIQKVLNGLSEFGEGIVGASLDAGTKFVNFLIGMLITVYMLADAERLKESVKRFTKSVLPKDKYERFAEICEKADSIVKKYFGDNIKGSLLVGIACYVFMKVTKLPYPLLISIIMFVTNFIPNFGPLIGLIISAIPIFIYNPMGVVWFTVFTAISQTIDGYIIQPLIFSDSMGLTPFWVLIAIIIGGGIFGIPGMLLGVPAAAIIDYITKSRINQRLIANGFPEDVQENQN